MHRVIPRAVPSLLIPAILAACGGGGSGESAPAAPAPQPAATAEGLWRGTTSDNRTLASIVLDDGSYWVLYTSPANANLIAGAVQGTGASLNGSFSSSNGLDFNLEGSGISAMTVAGSYKTKQTFNGSLTYGSGAVATFVGAYDAAYEQTPTLSALSGTYSGGAAVVGGSESASVSIGVDGKITGAGASGCTFTGVAAPRAKGNIYNVSITFGGGVCANGTMTVTGVAYYDAVARQLYATALNAARSNGFIFTGARQ